MSDMLGVGRRAAIVTRHVAIARHKRSRVCHARTRPRAHHEHTVHQHLNEAYFFPFDNLFAFVQFAALNFYLCLEDRYASLTGIDRI